MGRDVKALVANEVAPWESRLIAYLLFTTVLFALLPSGFSWQDSEENAGAVEGSLAVKLQWGGVFAVAALIVYRHFAQAVVNLRVANPFLLALCVYCAASTVWSPEVGVTLKKAIQFGGLILLSLAVQMDRRPWTHAVQVMLAALTAIELASAIAAIAFPSLGIDAYFGYAWRGIVSGKNTLGAIGALSTLLWVAVWRSGVFKRSVLWSGMALSLLCVVMSKSSTSIAIAALGVVTFWVLNKQHIGSPLWLQRLLVTLGLVVVLMTHVFFIFEGHLPDREEVIAPVAGLFGKSADLTGRADIWEPLAVEIDKHWLMGIGYGAFWLGPGSPSQPILDKLPWIPYQAHNGYLDFLNELGAVGVALFVGFLVSFWVSLSRLVRLDRAAAALFASILVTTLFSNLTESSMFRGVTFPFIQLVLACISTTSALNQRMPRSVPERVSLKPKPYRRRVQADAPGEVA